MEKKRYDIYDIYAHEVLHGRFPDFDFGENAQEDHKDPLQSRY